MRSDVLRASLMVIVDGMGKRDCVEMVVGLTLHQPNGFLQKIRNYSVPSPADAGEGTE